MGLTRNPDVMRLSADDPLPGYFTNKLIQGNGIKITTKTVGGIGNQLVFNCETDVRGSSGEVYETYEDFNVPLDASMVLVNASKRMINLTLPHPSEFIGWLSIVCVDNSNSIQLYSPDEGDVAEVTEEGMICDSSARILDKSNIEFRAAGDALIFASNRKDTWYCISRYSADWYQ